MWYVERNICIQPMQRVVCSTECSTVLEQRLMVGQVRPHNRYQQTHLHATTPTYIM